MGNVTASFTSLFDPSAFSVQSYETTFFMLSNFSGNFLYDNNLATRSVDIRFNGQLTSIAFTFATIEYHGGAGSEPSNLTLKAYLDTVGATPVGSATARGTWPEGNSFPQGKLSFDSAGQPFNLVRIELPFQGPKGASDFLMDNITVKVLGGSTDPGTPGGNGGDNSTTTEPPPDTSGGTNPTDGFSQPLLMALSLAVVAVLVAAVIMRLRGR